MGESIRKLFRERALTYTNNNALAFVGSEPVRYHELYKKVCTEATKLKTLGINKGDKIAILATNSPNWGISYLAITFIGETVVPILNDFSRREIQNILNHSEALAIIRKRAKVK